VIRVLERGDVCFFFRPAVQPADAEPQTIEPGVQSFFLVLSAAHGPHRRIRVGRKRMPAPSGERLWARVERVGSFERVLADQLEAEHYHTKTRGERFQPGARAIGQGCYAIVRHDDHCHLVYRVDHVEDDVPDEVRVPDAGSYVMLYERIPPARAIWTTDGEPARLDEEGAELVLVGVGDDPEHELGIDVLPVSEKLRADADAHAR
jgi:hypothetical protein